MIKLTGFHLPKNSSFSELHFSNIMQDLSSMLKLFSNTYTNPTPLWKQWIFTDWVCTRKHDIHFPASFDPLRIFNGSYAKKKKWRSQSAKLQFLRGKSPTKMDTTVCIVQRSSLVTIWKMFEGQSSYKKGLLLGQSNKTVVNLKRN